MRRFLAVIALVALVNGLLTGHGLMYLALAAYATYVINAGQFILKLRAARLDMHARQVQSPPLRNPFAGVSA